VEGVFFVREIDNSIPARVTLESANSRPMNFDVNCPAQVHWDADIEQAPVNQRSWVFQEVIMFATNVNIACTNYSFSDCYLAESFTTARSNFIGSATRCLHLSHTLGG
jgi:hypothetical protein